AVDLDGAADREIPLENLKSSADINPVDSDRASIRTKLRAVSEKHSHAAIQHERTGDLISASKGYSSATGYREPSRARESTKKTETPRCLLGYSDKSLGGTKSDGVIDGFCLRPRIENQPAGQG